MSGLYFLRKHFAVFGEFFDESVNDDFAVTHNRVLIGQEDLFQVGWQKLCSNSQTMHYCLGGRFSVSHLKFRLISDQVDILSIKAFRGGF